MTYRGGLEVRPELIYRGAEADVYRVSWCGRDAVRKVRKRLSYRLASLDRMLRRQRTVREAEMIHRAKDAGVRSPYLYCVEPESATIVMEYVAGIRLREALSSAGMGDVARLSTALGSAAARLHSASVMHGDLTTSNVVISGGSLVLIDFGLSVTSDRVEDHAVDLRLVKETITGAHPSVSQAALDSLFSGYRAVVGEGRFRQVMRQLSEIERRGRYARVV